MFLVGAVQLRFIDGSVVTGSDMTGGVEMLPEGSTRRKFEKPALWPAAFTYRTA
jgi:hypothetical protein